MRECRFLAWSTLMACLCCLPASAQEVAVAATVNGQPIPEVAVQRALKRLPRDKQAEARTEILDYLIDNVLLDQYLSQLRVEISATELETRLAQVKEELKKNGQTFDKVLQELMITEPELRAQLTAELRWEKYCTEQVTEKDLREIFTKTPEMFDGSTVRARHILLTTAPGDAQAVELAKQKMQGFRQQIEADVAKELAKLPATADNLAREKARAKAIDDAFAEMARNQSACPSKEQGGDLGWFPRAGSMVEPFARASFALKPFQMSDVVTTQWGCHLILVTDRKPGKEAKFEELKEIVRDVYCDRLRESICARRKPEARIVITPVVKP